MKIYFTPEAQQDYIELVRENKKIVDRMNKLIDDIILDPYQGIGKPKRLKHSLSGYWSRRIDEKHRLIYRIVDNYVEVARCKGHYDDK